MDVSCLPVDGGIADAGDGGEYARAVDLLLGLLTVSGTFDYELWEIDLPGSDIALYGRNDCSAVKEEGDGEELCF